MKEVTIYTDGACSGNPGPGGWGAILFCGGKERELSGGDSATTNNRMEMRAVIEALKVLKEPCRVEVYTDSKYVVEGMNSWVKGWQQRGWKTADKKPVKNVEMWQELLQAVNGHKVTFHWVKGHADNEHNNRADALAVAAIRAVS